MVLHDVLALPTVGFVAIAPVRSAHEESQEGEILPVHPGACFAGGKAWLEEQIYSDSLYNH